MPKGRNTGSDALVTQVAFRIGLPKGTKIRKSVLKQLVQRVIDDRPLPKNVELRGIFWQNPNRKGRLSEWRYHEGADLSALKSGGYGVESAPRGSLHDAIITLAPFLESGNITF